MQGGGSSPSVKKGTSIVLEPDRSAAGLANRINSSTLRDGHRSHYVWRDPFLEKSSEQYIQGSHGNVRPFADI